MVGGADKMETRFQYGGYSTEAIPSVVGFCEKAVLLYISGSCFPVARAIGYQANNCLLVPMKPGS